VRRGLKQITAILHASVLLFASLLKCDFGELVDLPQIKIESNAKREEAIVYGALNWDKLLLWWIVIRVKSCAIT
jgi:hypothetical protein